MNRGYDDPEDDGDGPRKPPTETTFDQEPSAPFPRELMAPFSEGPILQYDRRKGKPKIQHGDDDA